MGTTPEVKPELELKKANRKHAIVACFLLLVSLIAGVAYTLLQTPTTRILPSTIEALDASSNHVGNSTEDHADEILFRQFDRSELNQDKSELSLGASSSRSLLDSNFNLDQNTFLKENEYIDQGSRKRVKAGNMWYYLQQGSDGNLILYDDDFNVYWHSQLIREPDSRKYTTFMQADGNLITISRINFMGTPTLEFASYSPSSGGQFNVALTPDRSGLMIVRRGDNQIIWDTTSSGRSGPPPTPPANPPPAPPANPPPAPPANPPANPPPTVPGVTYTPGKLTRRENGLLLSEGLRSRVVARTGQKVVLDGNGGQLSQESFHVEPDGAAVFESDNGGWIYVSNSEAAECEYGPNRGGVGAISFDRFGRTTGYRMLIRGTTGNCSGGKTPWGTWVTCEEYADGRVYQVDPTGRQGMKPVTMDQGWFESFAYDIRNKNYPRFFVTEDDGKGALRRYTPINPNWNDPFNILHQPGSLEYLVLEPTSGNRGTYRWSTDKKEGEKSAKSVYPNSEGMDVYRNQLFFTTKWRKELFILDLDSNTYEKQSTRSGMFDGEPDQVARIVGDGLLYFCEENGKSNGVHARDTNGWYFTILEADTFNDETTGLAFSPDAKRMYVSFQHTGMIFDIWREDGLPFNGRTLDVRYH